MSLEEILGSPGRVRILRVLAEHGEMNISRLVRETGMHHRLVNHHIEVLKRHGVVVEKRHGRARLISLNRGNPLVETLLELFTRLGENEARGNG